MFSEKEIKYFEKSLAIRQKNRYLIRDYLLNSKLSLREKFIIAMSQLSTQMYGPLLEKLVIKELNLIKVKSNENRGDCKNKNNDYFEIKTGFINTEGKIKLQQIRPYQDLKAYLLFYYDSNIKDILIYIINKDIMVNICSFIKSSSHGSGFYKNEEKGVLLNIEDYVKNKKSLKEVIEFVR